MKVAKKDVIRLHYTGKIKETGEIFDTTYEDVAKEAGIYSEKGIYGPVPIAVGAGHVIKGLDEALEGLEVGKKYTIELPPEKAFGKRDPKLIKTFTIGQFRRQGIYPFPGLDVEIETESGKKLKGRVMSVSSGRVRVDFNHPYAGKTVVYEVEILEKIDDPIEKVKALIELRIPRIDFEKVQIEVGENDVKIDFGEQTIDPRTLVLGEILLESDLKFLGYEKIEFKPSVEELLKPPEAKVEEELEEEAKEEVKAETEEKAEETKEEAEETTGTVKEETTKEEKIEEQEKKPEESEEESKASQDRE
ncbi:peptidyl-prolyl cis-trans isomerase [Thermococcus litoralis DSM 5473]|uniref:Peptidyl-prolyl cis-trans isomerase n=1 Tax=Thermococcus litoralis (strain ATCC 51850 / DSM 5473 / JCM 8560 / NS-C) TaxID=523849 RepID=H3ZNC5_THELN|nr:peptidylprolyl isomerase [Thermococcus litoralis]EHR78549.1 peptidyl-prolyl cis-trans isomerase [Thermococcus litoralis DSM 5473]